MLAQDLPNWCRIVFWIRFLLKILHLAVAGAVSGVSVQIGRKPVGVAARIWCFKITFLVMVLVAVKLVIDGSVMIIG